MAINPERYRVSLREEDHMMYPNAQLMHSNRMMEKQLERAYKALELACEDLASAYPAKPKAGSPEAWLAYAQSVLERDKRNAEQEANQ